ncbi:MAG: prolipoprotein diacylglyceryl transferase, partial [Flammeovirgaceae bacterium]|nr:prolipoprotein diacylglyceryl transferase [Flammeovirgaceae bacterium]
RKNKIPTLGMLDIMAIVTCLVHGFGRIGCLMAGCCHGTPTDLMWGITFTNPVCQADPLNTPLHPTQLLESGYIFLVMTFLLLLKKKKAFDGQLFLLYLILYAFGRFFLEFLRGDSGRGFVWDGLLSNSQVIVLLIIPVAGYYYVKFSRRSKLLKK